MTRRQRNRLAGPLTVELTNDEILEDLSWPGRPPGQWRLARPPAVEASEKPGLLARTTIG